MKKYYAILLALLLVSGPVFQAEAVVDETMDVGDRKPDIAICPTDYTDWATDRTYLIQAYNTSDTLIFSLTPAGALAFTGTFTITGSLVVSTGLEVSGDMSYDGHKDDQIMLVAPSYEVDSEWTQAADGTFRLAASNSSKQCVALLNGLKVGDELTGFRILGQVESAGNTVEIDADLRMVAKGAADVSDSSVGAITQISVSSDTAVDTEKTISAETIAADTGYYVLITGSTNASTDIAIIGIEIDINRK